MIGYVGDTGDAKGTPHDHFERHPTFGARELAGELLRVRHDPGDGAVNPYPVLKDVCG